MSETSPQTSSFNRWKPIEIMLAVLLLLAPLYYHPNIGGSGLRIPNNITAWMVVSVIIFYSFSIVLKRSSYVIPKYFLYVAAFPVLVIVSGFITGIEQPMTWLFRLLYICGGLAFFFSLFQFGLKQGRIDKILFVISISALIQSLLGIGQVYFPTQTPFWWPESVNGVPAGSFQQINNQATYQVTAITIAIYLLGRPISIRSKSWFKALLITVIASATFITTFSDSRIGLLTLILSLLVITTTQWQFFQQNKKIMLIVVSALIAGMSFGFGVTSNIKSSIEKTVAIQSGYSGSARLGIYSISLDLIEKKPFFGHGVGSFGQKFQHEKAKFYEKNPQATLPNRYVAHPHNELAFWLVENGAIGGVGLLLFTISIAISLRSIGWKRGGAYTAMILPMGLHTQVELPFYITALHYFVFLLILFSLFNHHTVIKKQSLSTSANRLSYLVIGMTFIISISFFIQSLFANFEFYKFYSDRNVDFSIAETSPYFQKDVIWLMNRTAGFALLQKGAIDEETGRPYINWYKNTIYDRPDVELYRDLIKIYFAMGLTDDACKWLDRSKSLYPKANYQDIGNTGLCH